MSHYARADTNKNTRQNHHDTNHRVLIGNNAKLWDNIQFSATVATVSVRHTDPSTKLQFTTHHSYTLDSPDITTSTPTLHVDLATPNTTTHTEMNTYPYWPSKSCL